MPAEARPSIPARVRAALVAALGGWRAARMPPPAGAQGSPPLLSAFDDPAWLAGWPTADAENDRGVRPVRAYAQTRWDPTQSDAALRMAEQGTMLLVAQMLDAMRRDGLINGIMGVRTSGMLRQPVKFSGDPYLCDQLRGRPATFDTSSGAMLDPGVPGLFWDMFPESEQASIIFDGIMAGVGLGELVPRPGKPPRLRHLPLHWLRYRFEADFWYFNSGASGVPWAITTDTDEPPVAMDPPLPEPRGRFVLYTPYGRERVWIKGLWWPCSLPFIQRQNVVFDQLRWQMNLADPLKVITAQAGADEKHRSWLQNFATNLWRRAAALIVPPNYTADLVESNGRGWEVYQQAFAQAGSDIQVILAGSAVAVDGGTGFSNAPEFSKIGADKTGMIATTWATTLHEEGLRPWVASIGQDRSRAPWAMWDVRSPEQRAADARAMGELAGAVDKIDATLARRGKMLDLDAYLEEAGQSLPTMALPEGVAAPPLAAPSEPAEKPSNVRPMKRAA